MRRAWLEHVNPTVKALVVIASALLLATQYRTGLSLGVWVLCMVALLLISQVPLRTVGIAFAPAALAAFGMGMTGLWFGASSQVEVAGQLGSRVLAFAGLGLLFGLTTKGEEFVYSLRDQLRLSPSYTYGILASVHLLPLLKRELDQVKLAMKARGLHITPFSIKPLVPMLVHAIRWSELLAMAMESKGFSPDAQRTQATRIQLHVGDAIFAVVVLGGLVVALMV